MAAHAFIEIEYRSGREPEVVQCKDPTHLKSIISNRENSPDVTEIRVYPRHQTIGFSRQRQHEYHALEQPPPQQE